MSRRTRGRKDRRTKQMPAPKVAVGKPASPVVVSKKWDTTQNCWVDQDGNKVPSTPYVPYNPGPAYTAPVKREHVDLPPKVVTLDMDGTMEDPWACCGESDFFGGTEKCRHLRLDTKLRAEAVRSHFGPETEFVIVSWRTDLHDIIQEWCDNVGLNVARIFTDGSPDTKLLGHGYAISQVAFKVGIITELQARGVEVVAAFDDNQKVIDAINKHGVPALLSPHVIDPPHYHLAKVPPHAKQYRSFKPLSAYGAGGSLGSHSDTWWEDEYPHLSGHIPASNGASYVVNPRGKLTPAQENFLAATQKPRDRDLSHLGPRWKGLTMGDLSPADRATAEILEGEQPDDEDLVMHEILLGMGIVMEDEDMGVEAVAKAIYEAESVSSIPWSELEVANPIVFAEYMDEAGALRYDAERQVDR